MNLLRFLLFTFTLTWTAWIAPAVVSGPRDTALFGIGGPVFLLGVFAPGLVALGLTALGDGRAGVGRLLGRITRWDVAARWYLFAVSYMVAVKLAAAMIHRVFIGSWPQFGDTPWFVMAGAILLSTWVQAGEEIGWRGYALPRLATRMGLPTASVLLGAVWALWHLPLFLLPNTDSTGQSFPLYLFHVMALSVAMAWLYWKTGASLLLVMLMHASVNNTSGIVPGALPGATDPFAIAGSPVAWIAVALSWTLAIPLLFQMRRASIEAGNRTLAGYKHRGG